MSHMPHTSFTHTSHTPHTCLTCLTLASHTRTNTIPASHTQPLTPHTCLTHRPHTSLTHTPHMPHTCLAHASTHASYAPHTHTHTHTFFLPQSFIDTPKAGRKKGTVHSLANQIQNLPGISQKESSQPLTQRFHWLSTSAHCTQ